MGLHVIDSSESPVKPKTLRICSGFLRGDEPAVQWPPTLLWPSNDSAAPDKNLISASLRHLHRSQEDRAALVLVGGARGKCQQPRNSLTFPEAAPRTCGPSDLALYCKK